MSIKEKQPSPANVRVCRVFLDIADSAQHVSATKLRGFFGNMFVDDAEFHHHSERSYHYPLIQYKKADGRLMVMGLQEYANLIVNRLASIDTIRIQGRDYSIHSKDIRVENFLVENADCMYEYISPWLPLNEGNYAAFHKLAMKGQKIFLERILVGNVLSCLKGLGIFVNYRVNSGLLDYRALPVRVHGNLFQGFRAQFCLNVSLPEFVGLGKSVSKGFGIIRRKL